MATVPSLFFRWFVKYWRVDEQSLLRSDRPITFALYLAGNSASIDWTTFCLEVDKSNRTDTHTEREGESIDWPFASV